MSRKPVANQKIGTKPSNESRLSVSESDRLNRYRSLVDTGISLTREKDISRILDIIIDRALDATGADAQGSCSSGCATPAGFVSVSGDVSLDYALEAILRRRPEAALLAEPILKRLRGSP